MMASTAPTAAVSSSATLISRSVPALGAGISVSTLSVDTSSRGSSASTRSPTAFSQRVTVPSVTLSPSAGSVTDTGMSPDSLMSLGRPYGDRPLGTIVDSSAVRVQRLPGKCQVRLAERLVLARVGVDQLRDLGREGLPVDDQRRLADLLAHPGADHVYAHHRAVLDPHELDEALRTQNLALAVAAEVVAVGLDVVRAVLLLGLCLRDADGGDLRIAVGRAGD